MQSYFKNFDRNAAEEYLLNRIDGSCIVRPFKEEVQIFFTVSIYLPK